MALFVKSTSVTTHPSIACVAGETSGDLLAADILQGMKLHPEFADAQYYGIGGPRMIAQGLQSNWPIEKLSVRGYVEAIRQLPDILKIRSELIQSLKQSPPSVYIGIDAPDFNLGVEKHCRREGIPTVHYISPSIWAWRGGRIKGILKSVDHMLCIFPFEPEIYQKAGLKATYVGHPLASSIPLIPNPVQAKLKLFEEGHLQYGAIDLDETVITVLPGSRQSEIRLIAPGFFKAMEIMSESLGGKVRFIVPVATPRLREPLEQLRTQSQEQFPDLKIELLNENSSLALEAAHVVLIASGTATLEAALWKKPMVISYTVPWLTGVIMRKQAYLPYVGLPNILCREFVVPELLQEDATPENLARASLEWLQHPEKSQDLVVRFSELHEQLMRPTALLAADAIARTMKKF